MSGWTKGPWRAYGTTIVSLRGENDGPIALTQSDWVDGPTCEMNARLIAAAPEMADCLRDLLFFCEEMNPKQTMPEVWGKARAILARINGEGR